MTNTYNAPRINLAYLPTPLVFLKNLTTHLDGPAIYMKRDDCTGLATGGNKVRKLEFLLAEALQQNCDTVITAGGMQSNHVRQTAAAAAKLGLKCVLVLSESNCRSDENFKNNGNVLLDHIFAAKIEVIAKDANMAEELDRIYKKLINEGSKPYLIPMGGSNEIGVLGYVNAAEEMYQQCKDQNINATHLVCAAGSGGTQAGLIMGQHLRNWKIKVLGFSVGIKNPPEKIRVQTLLETTCRSLSLNPMSLLDYYEVDENYIGAEYGQPTPESIAAIKLVAQTEGILLDPVYTSKAMAGLIDYIRRGRFKKSDTVIFVNTGGNAALHAYVKEF